MIQWLRLHSQHRECEFSPWSGSYGPTCRAAQPTNTKQNPRNRKALCGNTAERHGVRSREASLAASARNSEASSTLGPSGGRTDAPRCGHSVSLLCLVFLIVCPGLPTPSSQPAGSLIQLCREIFSAFFKTTKSTLNIRWKD